MPKFRVIDRIPCWIERHFLIDAPNGDDAMEQFYDLPTNSHVKETIGDVIEDMECEVIVFEEGPNT